MKPTILILLVVAVVCGYGILIISMDLDLLVDFRDSISRRLSNYLTNETEKKLETCVLPLLDPWDPIVVPYLHTQYNPMKNCVQREMHTFLEDGQLRVFDNSTSNCSHRCLLNTGEMTYEHGKWVQMEKDVSYQINCDFVEVHCMIENETTFRYIHAQVVREKFKKFQMEDKFHPSVFILILDSTSSSNGLRTLMETVQIFRQYYDATTFYYHNKVGRNSRPNAQAIFAGRRIGKLDPGQFPKNSEPDQGDSCTQGLLRNETITYDFIDQGYATFYAEDWLNAFTWPNCIGYGSNIFDHYSNAYMRYQHKFPIRKEFRKYLGCRRTYHQMIEYFEEFLERYNGVAKFAKIWLSNIGHSSINGLYHSDKYFANFFRNQVHRLRNSFVFLAADHGMRFGGIRGTEIGRLEDNNPLLMIAVPEYLRSNKQLILNLRLNARRHTSQYDFYASLYDIANIAKRYSFETWNEINFRQELGAVRGGRATSLFRPINADRTCAEMEISDEFCICFRNWTEIKTNSVEVQEAAKVVVTYINDYLNFFNASNICSELSLKKVRKAELMEAESLLQITIEALPSNGIYETELRKSKGKFELATTVRRTDAYRNQGHCTQYENIRPLCYCKKQLPETKKKMAKLKTTQSLLRRR